MSISPCRAWCPPREHEARGDPVGCSLVDEVEQAAGGGHDDVDAPLKCCDLLALFDPAEDDRVVDFQVGAVVPDALANLGGEFAGWAQDEGADHAALVPAGLLGEPVQHGQGEGGRLAGAGLGDAEHITSVEDVGDGLGLNGGGGLVPEGGEGPHDGFAQSERMEIRQREGFKCDAAHAVRVHRDSGQRHALQFTCSPFWLASRPRVPANRSRAWNGPVDQLQEGLVEGEGGHPTSRQCHRRCRSGPRSGPHRRQTPGQDHADHAPMLEGKTSIVLSNLP